jgi:hypothetical protein
MQALATKNDVTGHAPFQPDRDTVGFGFPRRLRLDAMRPDLIALVQTATKGRVRPQPSDQIRNISAEEIAMLEDFRMLTAERQTELKGVIANEAAQGRNELLLRQALDAVYVLSAESFARLWDNPIDASYDDV